MVSLSTKGDTMTPEFASFLTIYAGFLCIACALAFGVWAVRETLESARQETRRQAIRRATVLTRRVMR
jgi:hypothetical protein